MGQVDIRELKVKEVMQTDWPTLRAEQTVEDAIKLFAERQISGAPVVDENQELVGIVTEGDLILMDANIKAPGFLEILGGIVPLGSWEEYKEQTIKSAGVSVMDVMTQDPVTIAPDATLAEAADAMVEEKVKMLPVVDQRKLVGLITRMDILTLHILRPNL